MTLPNSTPEDHGMIGRRHEDAVIVHPMTENTYCVFAFGPDAHYEATLHDGYCVLLRALADSEVRG